MKRISILLPVLVIVIYSLLTTQGCKKNREHVELDTIPPPGFYEFDVRVGDGHVYLSWHFPGLRDKDYGVEVTYYLNDVKKVQSIFGANSMSVSGLTNNVTYEFTLVAYDTAGNRTEGFTFKAIPNTPFVIVSPTSSDDYSVENGKVKIDLLFNRSVDTTNINYPIVMNEFIQLRSDSIRISYSYTWLEEGMVLSILTNETKESFCTSFPCSLYLRFHFSWKGGKSFYGLSDTNGMQLDADKDGFEMGEAELTFVLE